MDTKGIPGLLPLVEGLPMRLTEAANRKLKLFKHTTCVLRGWIIQDCLFRYFHERCTRTRAHVIGIVPPTSRMLHGQ